MSIYVIGSGRIGRRINRSDSVESTASQSSIQDNHWHKSKLQLNSDGVAHRVHTRIQTPDPMVQEAFFQRQEAEAQNEALANKAYVKRIRKQNKNLDQLDRARLSKAQTSAQHSASVSNFQQGASNALAQLNQDEDIPNQSDDN